MFDADFLLQAVKIMMNAFRIGLWQATYQACVKIDVPVVRSWRRHNCTLARAGNSILKTVKVGLSSQDGCMTDERVRRLHNIVKNLEETPINECSTIKDVRFKDSGILPADGTAFTVLTFIDVYVIQVHLATSFAH